MSNNPHEPDEPQKTITFYYICIFLIPTHFHQYIERLSLSMVHVVHPFILYNRSYNTVSHHTLIQYPLSQHYCITHIIKIRATGQMIRPVTLNYQINRGY